LTILLSLAAMTVVAQNPLVTHMYTADPTARVHDGRLFIYPSSDMVPPEGVDMPRFCMPGYHVFSLEGGSTWKDYGWILKENDVPWGARDTYAMWAPDCIEKDGKYYLFFPAKPANDSKTFRRIGTAVATKPEGPFKPSKTFIEGVSGIDPGLLLDDDNTAYLFWGGGHKLYVAPLSDDMTKITQEGIEVEGLPAGYKEGAFPFKKDGLYYLSFAHVFPEEGYTIGYATSDKPLGPYQYRGKIMDNINNGTNHHSVVNYNGQWILFYHFWHISGFNKMRSMCADYMTFKNEGKSNYDGTIMKVTPTLRGIGAPMPGDTIQIDRYNTIDRAQTAFVNGTEPTGWMVCEAETNSFVTFDRVDFGDGKSTKMQARMASGQRVGQVEVRQGNTKGKVIATFPIEFTGGWDKWKTYEVEMESQLKGVQNLCVVFKGENGNTKTANLNWLLIVP
ncbi:MAG: family 43 glycosylhydrolase, partial [Rikenellaceae bacterium]